MTGEERKRLIEYLRRELEELTDEEFMVLMRDIQTLTEKGRNLP